MSERIDDLESTVTKLVEESNQNQIGNNNNNETNQQGNWIIELIIYINNH